MRSAAVACLAAVPLTLTSGPSAHAAKTTTAELRITAITEKSDTITVKYKAAGPILGDRVKVTLKGPQKKSRTVKVRKRGTVTFKKACRGKHGKVAHVDMSAIVDGLMLATYRRLTCSKRR